MREFVEQLDENTVINSDGDPVPADDYADAYELPDVPELPKPVNKLQTQREAEQQAWDNQYDVLYERYEKNYPSPAEVRARVEKDLGRRPEDYVEPAQLVGNEAIHVANVQQKLDDADQIINPKYREKVRNEILAHERAKNEIRQRGAGPLRHYRHN